VSGRKISVGTARGGYYVDVAPGGAATGSGPASWVATFLGSVPVILRPG
jgi:hypothetical protein